MADKYKVQKKTAVREKADPTSKTIKTLTSGKEVTVYKTTEGKNNQHYGNIV